MPSKLVKDAKGLTPRQRAFVREYAVDNNATAAAIRAGYSKKGARTAGSLLLANENIQKEIAELQKKVAMDCGITAERLLLEYKRVALSTMGDYADWADDKVTLRSSDTLSADQLAAVSKITSSESQTRTGYSKSMRLELHDKMVALRALSEYVGMLEEGKKEKPDLTITGTITLKEDAPPVVEFEHEPDGENDA